MAGRSFPVLAACASGVAIGLGLRRLLVRENQAEQAQKEETNVKKFETRNIDGKAIAAQVRAEVKEYAAQLKAECGVTPGLAVILVGSRKDSQSYVRNKKKAADEVGFHTVDVTLPETVTQEALLVEVQKLNDDPKVHAILVQLPLPSHIDEALILSKIRVDKDADGFSAENVGNLCLRGGAPPLAVPCTPAGCIELIQRSNVQVAGKTAVVLGRSNIVGMPVAQILQSMDATVTVCHSRTPDMQFFLKQADIVVAAIGKPEFVRGEWLKPGCVVIDVGINAIDDATKKLGHRLVGDVNYKEAQGVASQITPVPGGVGPMTIAMLMKNTLNLARHSVHLARIPLRRGVTPPLAAPSYTAKTEAKGPSLALPKGEDLAVVVSCKGQNIWEAAVASQALRAKVQEVTSSNLPPALLLEGDKNGDAVSLVSLTQNNKVLCTVKGITEAVAALSSNGPAASASAAPVQAVKLKGDVALVVGCHGNVWEAAVSAGKLRQKMKDLSGMEALPPVVMESGQADGVSVIALGKDIKHSTVVCKAAGVSDALTALG
mmetsp:Transcript_56929/g.117714  ORF Transcript_56929/g.117714 Transcript_56929/m.117714 type:complete len:547 (-) Transcript_56929:196-1836(-)